MTQTSRYQRANGVAADATVDPARPAVMPTMKQGAENHRLIICVRDAESLVIDR